MEIEYKINSPVTSEQFIQLLANTTLGERRPIEDTACIQGMLDNSNLTVSACMGGQLVVIARSILPATCLIWRSPRSIIKWVLASVCRF